MMESSYCSQLESVFNDSVCEDWCLGVVGAIDDAYKETNKICRYPRFSEQAAHDTRSHIRPVGKQKQCLEQISLFPSVFKKRPNRSSISQPHST